MHYIPETQLSEYEIRASLNAGILEPWRRDGNNVMWYRSMPPINGVPAEHELPITADDDEYEFIEADDDDDDDIECEFYGDDLDESEFDV